MTETMTQHFVEFLSPGTFVAEQTFLPIDAWDIERAKEMSRDIKERHGATPFGFRFKTRSRGPDDLDSKVTATSPTYFLGGEVRTLEDVERDNLDGEEILRSNMRCNDWDRIITNCNSWKWTQPLNPEDVVLEMAPLP